MIVVSSQTQTVVIEGVDGLAPISVFLTDIAPEKGKVVIECGGKGWANTWSWMNGNAIDQWFVSLSPVSVAANFDYFHRNDVDFEKLPDYVKGEAEQLFAENKIDEDQFTEVMDIIEESSEFIKEGHGLAWCQVNSDMIEEILGGEWLESAPQTPNKEYAKMISIIKAAQAGVEKIIKRRVA